MPGPVALLDQSVASAYYLGAPEPWGGSEVTVGPDTTALDGWQGTGYLLVPLWAHQVRVFGLVIGTSDPIMVGREAADEQTIAGWNALRLFVLSPLVPTTFKLGRPGSVTRLYVSTRAPSWVLSFEFLGS